MFSAIRGRLHVSPAAMIATLALVFAMTGGAYAAKKYLITSTKQISPSVLKSLQGKAGPAGANGAQGPAGLQGSAGPAGPQGPAGAVGVQGAKGEPGAKGEQGAPGLSGWAEKLPSGKTLTGQFAASGLSEGASFAGTPAKSSVSFPFRVEDESGQGPLIHIIAQGATPPAECPGTAETPAAEKGNLCIYVKTEQNDLATAVLDTATSKTTLFGLTRANPAGFAIEVVQMKVANQRKARPLKLWEPGRSLQNSQAVF